MTVECWVKSNAVPGALLQKWGDDSIDDRSYSFEIEPDNRIQFGVSRDDTQSDSAYHGFLVGPVSTTQWRHIACTYDGLVRQTFVDGELVGTKPTSGSIHAGVTDLSIGGHLRNNNGIFSNGFNGLMDEVRLWNVARTRDEIRATINTRITPTSSGNYPGLVSCYNFEGSAGDSRGVNNGNPVGSATYVPVPDIPVLFDCNGNSVYDGTEIAANPALDLNANGILDSCECLVTSYCVGAPNSVGSGAVMDHAGTVSLGINNLTLLCTGCPPNTAGVFFYGPQQTQVAFGNGFRCVGGSITRTGPTAASGGGIAARNINFAAFPFNTTISAGSTQNFQFWYRNAAAGGAGFNLSNGLSIRFCP